MGEKVKVGVFGVGVLGRHHARIYSEIEDVQLVGVYDRDPDRAAEVAAAYGTRRFDSMADLASAIEAASIAVPTDKHFEFASALIAAGVHVLVEKPIAATTTEAENMVDMAQRAEVLLQVGHVERFNPIMAFLEKNLSKPMFIEALRLAPYPELRPDGPPRGTEVSVILDLMIHDLDIILHLVGREVAEIRAVGVPVLSRTEDIANVRLEFEGGCVANLTASRISQERLRKIRVFQEDAYLSLDYMNQSGQICRKNGAAIETMAVPIEKSEPLRAELVSFVKCVRERISPLVSGKHGFESLKLAVEICRAIQARR